MTMPYNRSLDYADLDFINCHMHSGPHCVSLSPAKVTAIAVFYFVHGSDFLGEYCIVVKTPVVLPSEHSLNLGGCSTQITCIYISSVGLLNFSSNSSKIKTHSPPPSDETSPAGDYTSHIVSIRNVLLDDVASSGQALNLCRGLVFKGFQLLLPFIFQSHHETPPPLL